MDFKTIVDNRIANLKRGNITLKPIVGGIFPLNLFYGITLKEVDVMKKCSMCGCYIGEDSDVDICPCCLDDMYRDSDGDSS